MIRAEAYVRLGWHALAYNHRVLSDEAADVWINEERLAA